MKIQLKPGYRCTSTVRTALIRATNSRVVEEYEQNRFIYWVDGFRFSSSKDLCAHLIHAINNWMGDNGLVNWAILREARYQRTDCPFRITSD